MTHKASDSEGDEKHPCRWFNGRCIDCGRSWGAPRADKELTDAADEPDWEHPCPFRGEPTKTPAGESYSACGMRESQINDTAHGVNPCEAPSKPGTVSLATWRTRDAGKIMDAACGVPGTFNDQGENHG